MNTSKGETSQDSKYLKPWYETGDNKAFFENELAKEINSNHPLFSKAVEAIAYSRMQDDVLFKINDVAICGRWDELGACLWQGPLSVVIIFLSL